MNFMHRATSVFLVLVSCATVASTPPAHTVVLPATAGQVVVVTWTGSSPLGAAGAGSTCATTGLPDPTEDSHLINLSVPAGAYDTVNVKAEFHIEWTGSSDLVMTLEKDGGYVADSDGGTPEENITVNNPAAGAFDAVVCSFLALGNTPYSGRLTLTATAKAGTGPADPDLDDDGVPNEVDVCPDTAPGTAVDATGCPLPTAAGLPPRFQIHVAPPALGNDAGEPSVGYNKFTQRTMFISYTNALRQTYAELGGQTDVAGGLLPQACEANWEDKSGLLTTLNTLDPILFTDEATGRTFNSQLSGANSLFEFTDDDGENWSIGQIGIPNGGADHQTVASGPFPAASTPLTALWPATGPKRAVYYCSQSVATAFCSRSDDGGQTFGPGFTFKNLDCLAGALHGHVKVAPDGTVYVPDSSQCVLPIGGTADNVVAFRSDNAGLTWTVKNVPSSIGGAGSDPSIGIATDGTLYMCYEAADSSVHMAVSKNKGDTWINDRNLGLSHGIVQTRFPHAIAGDPNRAACAFLGTTTPGNGSSLEFTGVWHGYVATTYDGGETYHLANVTPQDPVQGFGGVGPSGTNRNLLDFNDLQLDDQGRLLFAFADGCIGGCVKDPAANSFAAKGTIVRQVGGRTMLSAFDNQAGSRYNNPAPLPPAAACARQDTSQRTVSFAKVRWNAPDNGARPVTNYKVYRSLTPVGGYVLLGSAGTATEYVDTTVDPLVEKYYYKVGTDNAIGPAPDSNVIELVVQDIPVVDPCTLPGEIIAVDDTGDSRTGLDDVDLVYIGVAEPGGAFADTFVVTLKVANFTTGQPPATSFYPLLFPTRGSSYIAMDATQAVPRYTYGTYQDVAQGVLQFTEAGTLDARSGFDPDGTIRLVVPRSVFGNPGIGSVIAGFDARTRIGSQSATSEDTAGPADYLVRGAAVCDLLSVLGQLKASVNQGLAPLNVRFTISGTPSAGRTLDSYAILFGDEVGATPTTGDFSGTGPTQVSHTYQAPGIYRARVMVTDSAGATSTNLAEETITVVAAGTRDVPGNNRLGGAVSLGGLLVLGLIGVLRRRGA